jgi:hypothetical protein
MIAARVARIGARGTDSLSAIGAAQAIAIKQAGFDFCVRYLGSATAGEVQAILDAGLGFMPVTFAEHFDGPGAVLACKKLGIPSGVTVWLDVEGKEAWAADPAGLGAKIDAWAAAMVAAGYMPGLYVGAPQPFTSAELYVRGVTRYWHGQGRCVDRTGELAEPKCGWCMTQMWPSTEVGGVPVDVNIVGEDYFSRLPAWAESAP